MKIIINTLEELNGLIAIALGGANIKEELQLMAKTIQNISDDVKTLKQQVADNNAAIEEEHQQVIEALGISDQKLAEMQTKIDELTELVKASGTQAQIEEVLTDIQETKDAVAEQNQGIKDIFTPAEPTEGETEEE